MKTDANGGFPVCTCTTLQIRKYLAKGYGPLLDRIDIHIEILRLSSEELMSKRAGENSATVRRRVVKAREKHLVRMRKGNDYMKTEELREHCDWTAAPRLAQSGDSAIRLKWAWVRPHSQVRRAIADLEDAQSIEMHHVAQAINYRTFDRRLFG